MGLEEQRTLGDEFWFMALSNQSFTVGSLQDCSTANTFADWIQRELEAAADVFYSIHHISRNFMKHFILILAESRDGGAFFVERARF